MLQAQTILNADVPPCHRAKLLTLGVSYNHTNFIHPLFQIFVDVLASLVSPT